MKQLEVLCKSNEFSIKFQMDKALLNALNKNSGIRFPVKGKVTTIDQKIGILIQCALGSIDLPEKGAATMTNETAGIFQQCNRIIRCIIEVCVHKKDAFSLRSAIDL